MTVRLLRSLAAVGLAAALAACATEIPGAHDDARLTTERFKIEPTTQPHEVLLAVHAQGLSQRQAAALNEMAAQWVDDEGGLITVQAPSDGVDSAAAYRMTESVRSHLLGLGVPPEQIQVAGYDARGEASAPLKVGYDRYRVEIPKCGQTWTNITRSMNNDVQPNFGCAVTANMAAQLANPSDLAHPRAMTPQDAARRQVVLDKYRAGEKTSSAKDEQAAGVLSTAIQ